MVFHVPPDDHFLADFTLNELSGAPGLPEVFPFVLLVTVLANHYDLRTSLLVVDGFPVVHQGLATVEGTLLGRIGAVFHMPPQLGDLELLVALAEDVLRLKQQFGVAIHSLHELSLLHAAETLGFELDDNLMSAALAVDLEALLVLANLRRNGNSEAHSASQGILDFFVLRDESGLPHVVLCLSVALLHVVHEEGLILLVVEQVCLTHLLFV